MTFIPNVKMTCAILEDEGGNEHTMETKTMLFNTHITSLLWYADHGKLDVDVSAED
jgi:hypothetical protein